jgi:plastocyanin
MKKAAVLAALAVSLSTFLPFEAVDAARAADAAPRVHTVMIEGMRYQPEGLTVAAGDTVVWINRDMVSHTTTSPSGRFDSNEIAAGKSWTHTVRTKGEFPYICTYHPQMKAVLRVR